MKITGKAHVRGLNGSISYTGVASPSAQLLQSAGFVNDCEFKEPLINPATAEVIGGAYARRHIAGDIEFIPVAVAGAGNTLSNAKAGLAFIEADLPILVTLSGFDLPALNASYQCEGPISVQFTPEGVARFTLPIKRYIASGSDATTLTTVIT